MSTPLNWLPTMSNIAPPAIRRDTATQAMFDKIDELPEDILLKIIFNQAPETARLKSRKPFYKSRINNYSEIGAWQREWVHNIPRGGEIIVDPTKRLPGFGSCSRGQWTASNRLLCKHGRVAANIHRWGLAQSPECPRCHGEEQTVDHLVLRCPETAIGGAFEAVLQCDEYFKSWLREGRVEV